MQPSLKETETNEKEERKSERVAAGGLEVVGGVRLMGDGKESLGFQLQDSTSFCVSAIAVVLSVELQPAGHQGETLALTKAGRELRIRVRSSPSRAEAACGWPAIFRGCRRKLTL